MAKKAKKKKLNRGETIYKPEFTERVREIIFLTKPVKSNGELEYGKLAKVMGIKQRTFNSWRNPESQYYKTELAQAIIKAHKELIESIDAGLIKKAMIARSKPYTRVKKTKELKTIQPYVPGLSGLDKAALLMIAGKLGVKDVDSRTTKGVLKIRIAEEVEAQTKQSLVVVKEEEERMHGDVNAAKFVLPHIGPKDERWIPQEKLEVEAQSLADIAAIMTSKRKRK